MEECLPDVAYRQWDFSLPKALRVYFRFDRELRRDRCRDRDRPRQGPAATGTRRDRIRMEE